MTTLNVPLSDEARRFLEEEASRRGLPDTGAVVARLVTEAMARERDEAELTRMMDEGLASGPAVEADDAYWDRKQADLLERAKALRGSRG
jgi:antitoxin ParD1/3/4